LFDYRYIPVCNCNGTVLFLKKVLPRVAKPC